MHPNTGPAGCGAECRHHVRCPAVATTTRHPLCELVPCEHLCTTQLRKCVCTAGLCSGRQEHQAWQVPEEGLCMLGAVPRPIPRAGSPSSLLSMDPVPVGDPVPVEVTAWGPCQPHPVPTGGFPWPCVEGRSSVHRRKNTGLAPGFSILRQFLAPWTDPWDLRPLRRQPAGLLGPP